MLFQSFAFFFVFLPLCLVTYWSLPGKRAKQLGLLIASYIFYGYWDWRFLGIILLSSVVDFICGALIARSTKKSVRRAWLTVSIVVNLSMLGLFKYYDFFAESMNAMLTSFGLGVELPILNLILPVGISFYTFQSMSYTIDVYRGQVEHTSSLVKLLVFVAMFPQLVAGPIVRYSVLDKQLDDMPKRPDPKLVALGINFIVVGLAKKVLVADTIGAMLDPLLHNPQNLGAWEAWTSLFIWNFKVYFDFSGYSDMAVGLGLLLGFTFPINFNSPFKAESVSEFWNRWHVTLSHWMRDYVFFPLGGSLGTRLHTYRNLIIVFFLIGVWHGANWNCVLFGVYFSIVVVAEDIGKRLGIHVPSRPLRRALMFIGVLAAPYFLLSPDLSVTGGIAKAAIGLNGAGDLPALSLVVALVLCLVQAHALPNTWEWKWRYKWWEAAGMALIFLYCLTRFFETEPFIYFQF